MFASSPPIPGRPDRDRILVLADGGAATLELLRLAVLRSDDVVAVIDDADARVRRFAEQFAIDLTVRAPRLEDLQGAVAVLIALGDPVAENRFIRAARAADRPIHVAGRPLVSDFTALAFLEQRPFTQLAA